jgi:hypothetical protein
VSRNIHLWCQVWWGYSGSFFLKAQGWPSFCVLWAVQRETRFVSLDSITDLCSVILQLRVYALYRRSRAVLIAMAVGFTAEVIVMSMFLGIGMAETTSEYPLICTVTPQLTFLSRYKWANSKHQNLCRHPCTVCTCVRVAARYYFWNISVRACCQGWVETQ